MKILAIETATACQSVALLENATLLGERVHEECPSHTRMLLPSIDDLLRSLHLTLSQVDGLAVSLGPGSFTGLRVGLSTVTAMRLARGLPVVGISTLAGLAWNGRGVKGRMCPMIRSRHGEVYWAQFEWVEGHLTRLTPDRVGTLEECGDSLTEPVWVLGDGWITNRSGLESRLGSRAKPLPPGQQQASAASVGLASRVSFREQDYLPVGASPTYVLPSQAEVQWNERQAAAGKKTVPS